MILRQRQWIRKPGQCDVKRGHPLAHRLISALTFDSQDRGGIVDKMSGEVWSWLGGAGITIGPEGIAGDFNGTDKRATSVLNPTMLATPSKVVSVFIRLTSFANLTNGQSPRFFACGVNSGSSPYVAYAIGTNYFGQPETQYNTGGTYRQASSSKYPSDLSAAGTPWNIMLRIWVNNGLGSNQAYQDLNARGGVTKFLLTSGYNGYTADFQYTSNVQGYIGQTGAGTKDLKAHYHCIYVWNDFVPTAAFDELCQAPYQLLEGARNRRFIYSSGGAAVQPITGSSGIASAEAFGSGASVVGPVSGTSGVTSAEAFGSGGTVVREGIDGLTGIPSEEAFGSTGSLVAGLVNGTAGIASDLVFGSGGAVSGPITGTAGIDESSLGYTGVVSGPITGTAGIDQSTVGSAGVVAGPVTGTAGIASGTAFGSGGQLLQPIVGVNGIESEETFGSSGAVVGNMLNGWEGIASAETFGRGSVLGTNRFDLFIGGRRRTGYLRVEPGLSVQMDLGSRATCNFELFVKSTWRQYKCNPGEEVKFYEGTALRFAGLIQDVEERWADGFLGYSLKVRCSDYTELLERRFIAKTYAGPTHVLSTIVADIVTNFLLGEGITYTCTEDMTLTNQGKLIFNDETVFDALSKVASVFGFQWWVDFNRNLRFERSYRRPGVMNFTDDDGLLTGISVTKTNKDYRNKQGVRTSIPASGQRTQTFVGNNTHTYPLMYTVSGAPVVKVNDIPKIVVRGRDYQGGPWDFAYEVGSSYLWHNPSYAVLGPLYSINIVYPSTSLDVVWYEDEAVVAARQVREGSTSSGQYGAIIEARNIIDRATAEQFCRRQLERHGQIKITINCETNVSGWEPGMLVGIWRTKPLVAGTFLIQSVSYTVVGKRFMQYRFTCAGVEPPIITGIEPDGDDVVITFDTPVPYVPGDPLWITDVDRLPEGWCETEVKDKDGLYANQVRVIRHPCMPDWTVEPYNGGGGGWLGYAVDDWDPTDPTDPYEPYEYNPSGGYSGLPFGGYGFSGLTSEPGSTGGSTFGTNDGRIVVGLTIDPGSRCPIYETESSHGLMNGDSVSIHGVNGGYVEATEDGDETWVNQTSYFNTERTRVEVLTSTTFRALDMSVPVQHQPFINDRHGRVYDTDSVPRPTIDDGAASRFYMYLRGSAEAPQNRDMTTATFVLANSIPGFASRPLATGANVTNEWIAQKEVSALDSVSVYFSNPPTGSPIQLDIKKNGVSIMAPGSYVEFPADGTETVRVESGFAEEPLLVNRDDRITMDVVSVGSEFAGCNGTVTVSMRG